ncbi:ATP-dependent DNA helicase tlh1 [Venturia nashicola]|uniref:ATP-dependent DNA helicase tlh1 n=1 Tax=Venturia nashicola TaxID=86259 RepID=A0A4Z1NSQ7_9PEZI|nr:ATP-dependent DNA helicase tlh1 [Venturia nashicola]TLD19398.1 ATP-dependent DNA helicase tlh1 [Venturia nashicola]
MINSTPLSAESLQYIHGGAYTHEDSVQLSESLLQDAARLLCQNLLFTSEHFLHAYNLTGIHDDYLEASEGYSFLSDFRNDFTSPAWACNIQANIWNKHDMSIESRETLARIFHEASLGRRSDEASHHLIQQYENSAQQFLEYLVLLILLSGGQPDGELRTSEGFVSELVSLRFTNSQGNIRPIYISSGGFVQIDNLNTLRARILPKHVGTMLVVYLIHVRPFLARISPLNPVASSNFLFPTAQGHWHTQSYMQLMPRESQRRISKSLSLDDINDVHIRYIKETNPASLTAAMWERLKANQGGGTLPVAVPNQLPSSEITQQWKALQTSTPSPSFYNSFDTMAIASRTPSPAVSDASLSSSGVLLPFQYSLPSTSAIPEIKTSFSAWSSSSDSSLCSSPAWTPTSTQEPRLDAMFEPCWLEPGRQAYAPFPVSSQHQHIDPSNSPYPNASGTTAIAPPPPSPTNHVPQGGISLMGFIPWEAEKKSEKPTSRNNSKRKANNNKNKDKIINSKAMKKSPKNPKAGRRTSRQASLKTEDEEEIVARHSTNGSVSRILENLGLTNAVLKQAERGSRKRRETMLRGKAGLAVADPVEQTDRMLANLGLTKFVIDK